MAEPAAAAAATAGDEQMRPPQQPQRSQREPVYFDVDGKELCLKFAGFQKGKCRNGDACHRSHGTPDPETLERLKARAADRRAAGAAARGGPPAPSGTAVVARGLQYAAPYDERKITWLKERYAGLPLSQVLAEMWRLHRGEQPLAEAVAHWRGELTAGRVLYRKRKRSIDDPYKFISPDPDVEVEIGSAVQIVRHVHERVVPAVMVRILFENESMLAIDKPSGIATIGETMGPNSLMGIVRRQTGIFGVEPGHRLDKPVSGVLLLGKSRRQAARLLDKIQKKDMVEKVYVARVQRKKQLQGSHSSHVAAVGVDEFPAEEFTVAAPIGWESAKSRAYVHAEGAVTSSEGSDAAALAVTHFKRLDCNGAALPDGTVLVACRPKTGQRHQIRVHLEHIGWPIANDSLYGGTQPAEINPDLIAYRDDPQGTLMKMYTSPEHWRDWCPRCKWTRQQICNATTGSGDGSRPSLDDLGGIWLHAHRYKVPESGIDVEAPLPAWAGCG